MVAEENKVVIRRLIEEVYNEDSQDVLDELVAPDVFNHSAVPDVHYAVEGMIAEGDMVACRVTCSGTHEGELWGILPTGKRFSVEHVHWHRLADGKLVERWGVRDDLGMVQQLGVVMSAPEQLE